MVDTCNNISHSRRPFRLIQIGDSDLRLDNYMWYLINVVIQTPGFLFDSRIRDNNTEDVRYVSTGIRGVEIHNLGCLVLCRNGIDFYQFVWALEFDFFIRNWR